jgi:hypothetical protein
MRCRARDGVDRIYRAAPVTKVNRDVEISIGAHRRGVRSASATWKQIQRVRRLYTL